MFTKNVLSFNFMGRSYDLFPNSADCFIPKGSTALIKVRGKKVKIIKI